MARPPYQDLGRSAFWLAAGHGLRHEAAKLLRLPRVGLRLWKSGLGPSTDGAAIMTPIAQRLSTEDIDAVVSYFAALPPQPNEGP